MPIRAAQGFALRDSGAAGTDIDDVVSIDFERPLSGVVLPFQHQKLFGAGIRGKFRTISSAVGLHGSRHIVAHIVEPN